MRGDRGCPRPQVHDREPECKSLTRRNSRRVHTPPSAVKSGRKPPVAVRAPKPPTLTRLTALASAPAPWAVRAARRTRRSDPRPQIHDRVPRPRCTRAQSRLCPRRPAAGSDVPRWVRRPAAGGGGAYRLCYGFNSDVARTVKPGARRPCLTRNRTESTAAIELPMTASTADGHQDRSRHA